MSWSHRLATLEPSPSFATIVPVQSSSSSTMGSSRSSPFERRLAKYRSLPLLWLRTCGSTTQHSNRRAPIGSLGKDSILHSLGHFGEWAGGGRREMNSTVYIRLSSFDRNESTLHIKITSRTSRAAFRILSQALRIPCVA